MRQGPCYLRERDSRDAVIRSGSCASSHKFDWGRMLRDRIDKTMCGLY